jgi:hypothetical protein
MPIKFIKRADIPINTKGKAATEARITISDKGQITFNPVATKFLNGGRKVALGFDAGKVYFIRPDNKTAAKAEDKDFLVLKAPQPDKKTGKVKSNILYLSFGTALGTVFGDHLYNFKDSGSQSFPVTLDEKNALMYFTLPNGALPKKPFVPRKKKQKPPTGVNGSPATAGATAGNTANTASAPPPATGESAGEDLVLE